MKKQGMPMPRFKVKAIKRRDSGPNVWMLVLAGAIVFLTVLLPFYLRWGR